MMRRWILVLCVLAWASIASAQWVYAPKPMRNSGEGTLADIKSRNRHPAIYDDNDPVTAAHELTHGLNSDMRQIHQGYNCFYVLGGVAARLREPRVTLSQLAKAVPSERRGRGYRLYLIEQQRYWNNEPLYVFDEWSAYLNGAKVAVELNIPDRFMDSFQSAIEFAWYAHYLLGVLPEGYDAKPFRVVLTYQIKRCQALQRIGMQKGWLHTH